MPLLRHPLLLSLLALCCLIALPATRLVAAEPAAELTCPACRGDGVCHARGCKEGKIPCPANCLKLDSPGWIKRAAEGDSQKPDLLWMPIEYREKGEKQTAYFSQEHVGELIAMEKGKPVLRGRCPTCKGTSHVECRTCGGSGKCFACLGAGKFIRDRNLFTFADLQGREMEAVVRARKTDSVTVLRIADLQIFDIPLDKLSAESNERIEQRFPAAKP